MSEEEPSDLDTSATRVRMTLRRRRHRLYGWIATVVILLGIELASFFGARLVRSHNLTFVVPQPPGAEWYESYLRDRDPTLGWPAQPEHGGDAFDVAGKRPPSRVHGGAPVAIVYGDGLAYGTAVDHGQAWSQQLSDLLQGDVFNFGVVGYGLDQALLRYENLPFPDAKRVLLTMHTGMLPRNLTRNRDLSAGVAIGGLKPRFVLQGDELELIPLPDLSYEDYLRHVRASSPPLELPHESFEPGGPAGVIELGFPYTVSMLRAAFGDYRLRASITGDDPRAAMWQDDHPLGGAALTEAILRRFRARVEANGQTMTLVLVPLARELAVAAEDLPYAAMVTRLEDDGLEVWDLHSCLVAASDMTTVGALYQAAGQLSETGNIAVARCLETRFAEAG